MRAVNGSCELVQVDGACAVVVAGGEAFWTVTGDNVTAMTFCDVDEDGQLELLVALARL